MRIERIDTNEIIGLTCPKTGNRILWDDEDISCVLPGAVVFAVVCSLCPEDCGVGRLPLSEAWRSHYASANTRKMTLDEVVEAFPAPGKALKVVSGGMACAWVTDVSYYNVPVDLPDGCFIHAEAEESVEAETEE